MFNFQEPPPPLPSYVQISTTTLTLDVQFKKEPPYPNDNQSIKRKQFKDDHYMLSGLSFRSAFVLSFNSSVFPLVFLSWSQSRSQSNFKKNKNLLFAFLIQRKYALHAWAEASLCTFSVALCSCVCSCPKISGNIF